MSESGIYIEGLDEAIQILKRLDKLDRLKPYIKAAGAQVKGAIAVYPPSSAANVARPWKSGGPNSWYIRGRGPFWVVKSGEVRSKKTSETLGRKWTNEPMSGGLAARIGNNVSYGPYVHDPKDQASFHKNRGWKNTEQVADEQTDEVAKIILAGIEKILGGSQ